jgi:hypothetical protein
MITFILSTIPPASLAFGVIAVLGACYFVKESLK